MYEQVARPDKSLREVMERFVCVHITRIASLDHSVFRFDKNLSFAAMFMNADFDIYGRYGTRSGGGFVAPFRSLPGEEDLADKDVSKSSFQKAAQKALELHAKYDKDKGAVSRLLRPKLGKRYLEKPTAKPTSLRTMRGGRRGRRGCVHCHEIAEREIGHYWNEAKPVPDQELWSYPMPDQLGLFLDPNELASVSRVEAKSEAATAGFAKGDCIQRIDGVPMLSIADVQWALHEAPDQGKLDVALRRGDKDLKLSLQLPKGWRRRAEFAWRYSFNELKWQLLGVDRVRELKAKERAKLEVKDNESSIYIGRVLRRSPGRRQRIHNRYAFRAGLRSGDVIVAVDKEKRQTQSEFLAYLLQLSGPEVEVTLTVLREGKRRQISYPLGEIR